MTDREKLIKAIEKAKDEATEFRLDRISVPFKETDMLLAVLKEQEPVKPIPPSNENDLWRCGNCQHQLLRLAHNRYCECCGRKVKWDD